MHTPTHGLHSHTHTHTRASRLCPPQSFSASEKAAGSNHVRTRRKCYLGLASREESAEQAKPRFEASEASFPPSPPAALCLCMAPQPSVPCKQPGPPWRLPWETNLVQAPGLSARLLALCFFFFFFFSLGAVTFGGFGAASAKQVSGPQVGTALVPAPAYVTMGLLGNAVPVTEKRPLHRQGEALWVRDPEPARKEGRASGEPAGFLGRLCLWPRSRHRHRVW